MYWYRVAMDNGSDEPYNYIGSSNESLDGLVAKASRGEYIHLTNLLYWDRNEFKEWAHWDSSLEPEIYINPTSIYTMMQFKGDPRVTPSR